MLIVLSPGADIERRFFEIGAFVPLQDFIGFGLVRDDPDGVSVDGGHIIAERIGKDGIPVYPGDGLAVSVNAVVGLVEHDVPRVEAVERAAPVILELCV